MKMFLVALMLVLVLMQMMMATACTEKGCANHLDFGSCGNACCKLYIKTTDSPEAAMNKMNSTFIQGGPDSQYTTPTLASGTVGFDDLRPYGVEADFLGQTYHVTDKGTYTDTQNWVVYSINDGSKMKSKIEGFSISQIGGAYGDDGQNWYNLAQIFQTLWPESEISHADKSCMQKSNS